MKNIHGVFVSYADQTDFKWHHLPKTEELLHFLRSLNNDILVFGYFNIDFLRDYQDRKNYENLLTVFDFEIHNSDEQRFKKD